MEIWRPTEVGRSVPLLVVVIARVWRKSSITSDFQNTIICFRFSLFRKLEMYDLMCARPILYERNINNPGSSKFLPIYQAHK